MQVTRRREGKTFGRRFTIASYLCALAFAAVLVRIFAPGGIYHGTGLEKRYLPYLVLELPVDSAGTGQGPLAELTAGGEPGSPHDTIMKKQRLDGEEYLQWLRQWSWEGEHLIRRVKGVKYEIYWVPAIGTTTRVPIPVGYEFSVSGDGGEGFVVTAWEKREPGIWERLMP